MMLSVAMNPVILQFMKLTFFVYSSSAARFARSQSSKVVSVRVNALMLVWLKVQFLK